ncbi:cytochrome-c oxidase, cbb3-type subunit III [Neisseria perflava]|uniref:cytochrome-c oxidase, cbb3-type subunit III n=1 Tax=Neisseria perflava TaxID=33053 RepID=UPI00209FB7AE|nr:cytochrome-c oxidase, cbb3-type subunit III [Neisseria perflava]MCP1659165.1 cytochrome c oxidase cbb3-type subunit 3 [Neisseria perflava]MCP1773318.1 cytochrome c oxidase cbb3-type subunit 3 [Neisseria perflava]
MNTTSQFTSNFWNIYIAAIVVLSFIGLAWLLFSQNVVKQKKGEEVKTTGHEWDGIAEYNNPLPRWWFWLYVLTWIFGAVYIVLFPGLGDFKGLLGWTSHNQYEKEVAKAEEQYKPLYAKFANMPIEQVAKDPQAQQIGKNMFDTYCIQCHGSDAKGSKGFPNLTDHDWLWGGTPEKIQETIQNGRTGVMAAWGPALGEERVKDVANYVMSLSKPKGQYDEDRAARGDVLFHGGPANCFTCHGDKGQGIQGLGPNLTDSTWLWGGTQKAIIETITNGRHSQMPAWGNFLDKDKLHIMTAYVWGLSNKDGKAPAKPVEAAPAAASAAPVQASAASAPAAAQASQPAVPAADVSDVVFNANDGKPLGTFYFATGKSEVPANAATVLTDIVKAGKEGKRLVISGYTDSTGNAAANAELSKKRAQAVQAFLEAQGVKVENIELRKPENTTAAQGNDAAGRRVEVKVEG